MLKHLDGWKTYIAAVGLIGLAVYQFSVGEYTIGFETLMAALAAFGIRHAMARKGM